jgi:hypothetical protein
MVKIQNGIDNSTGRPRWIPQNIGYCIGGLVEKGFDGGVHYLGTPFRFDRYIKNKEYVSSAAIALHGY